MDFLRPTSLADALAIKAEQPDAVPLQGGTDVMVELNFDRRRPPALLDLTRIEALRDWDTDAGVVRLGAGVTYARVVAELTRLLPGLALASRTVGSPQIRNRATVVGNLGAASPAGDAHPPLLASEAQVEVASVRGVRRIRVRDFYTGVKRSALAPDELIAAVHVPSAAGPQQFAKIGTRNAMVIAVVAFALALDPARGWVGTGIGSAAPTPRRAPEAEQFLAGSLDAHGLWQSRGTLPESLLVRFGELVAAAADPIDDVRGTAAYRRHALAVIGRRALSWAWTDYQTDDQAERRAGDPPERRATDPGA
jgi:CO/xanthine dehydrogenase FAD-binding subunit